jgi:hypothetical protein
MFISSSVVKVSAGALALAAAITPGAGAPAAAAASCLKITANIPVPATEEYAPHFSAMDPVTDTLYLASPEPTRGESFVYVVSGTTNTVQTTITVPSEIQGLVVDTPTDT